jgi:hypothetical protein
MRGCTYVVEDRLVTIAPPDEAKLIAQRTQLALDQWPHLNSAWACANCEILFRFPTTDKCPCCGSESVFDLGAALSTSGQRRQRREFAETKVEEMIEALDEVIDGN